MAVCLSLVGGGCGPVANPGGAGASAAAAAGRIKHVVMIMQENRSFDTYFGTYPGADGIPMDGRRPRVCIRSPDGGCVKPFHDRADVNGGGPHGQADAVADVHGGAMDGFVVEAAKAAQGCADPNNPACGNGASADVMGWKDAREIPNYWSYAHEYVLQDHMFEPTASWSLPAHLSMVSGWSARCASADPASCTDALQDPAIPPAYPSLATSPSTVGSDGDRRAERDGPEYAWTDLTYLLHKAHVPWGYYVVGGTEPDCANDAALSCTPVRQGSKTPGIWNPLPYFDTVRQDGEEANVQPVSSFYGQAQVGTLPAVSWVVPSNAVSEHPPSPTSAGQAYVTSLVNAVMAGPDWGSTAIFLAWDDWGGFYDHVVPPSVDRNGYGLRVPGLLISPYAKKGYVDHQTLSFDAYAKLIEDIFLGGQRLDPATDGRPDRRPTVRERSAHLGDLLREFDFTQPPRPPTPLPVHPPPGPASQP